jgi:histidinol-phosphatase (PHP family)
MIKTDFHLHTTLSNDAPGTMDDMVRQAIALGLDTIAITDHADFNPLDPTAGFYVADKAWQQTLDARRRFGDQITIRHGVELGEPHLFPDDVRPIMNYPLDIVIGSVHFMHRYGVHSNLFDVYSPAEGIEMFFDFTLDMAAHANIDVLAHLDYFDRYTTQRNYPPYRPDDFKKQIQTILQTIIDRKIALEVNLSGFRSQADRSFPHPQVLQWYRQMGGRLLSISSDAHQPDQMGKNFDRAEKMLLDLDFTEYHTFENRIPQPRPLSIL